MCGIAAIFAYHTDAPPVDCEALIRVRDHMTARGPDAEGLWVDPSCRVGLAHRRLSIIDLTSGGAQPMLTEDQSLAVVFNGEIYNYQELRSQLESKGVRFRSSSDTEILLHLYRIHGREMLPKLRGMYAFAIWDAKQRGLFVARDPFGIKPLYYSSRGGVFWIASQVGALRAGADLDTSPDAAGHVGFFLWGHVPEPFTLFRGIRALPAGSGLWVDGSGVREVPAPETTTSVLGGKAFAQGGAEGLSRQDLHDLLLDSVKHHLIADVPVGVFLSAGLDSGSLVGLAAESGIDLRTVTLGFEEFRGTPNDEVPLAEVVAKHYGARHQTVWISKAEFQSEADHLFRSMDQPSIDGVNTFFVSRAARRAGLKVALSGLGGDEVFGGYDSFRQIPKAVGMFRWSKAIPLLGRCTRRLTAPVFRQMSSPKYASVLEYGGTFGGSYLLRRGLFMPWEISHFLDHEIVEQGLKTLDTERELAATTQDLVNDRSKVSALELNWYMRNQLLRDTDWASMAHSIEVRVPLVDVHLLRQLAGAVRGPKPPSKIDMASSLSKPLPDVLLKRPKSGFVVPVRDWLTADQPHTAKLRGLRGWACYVYRRYLGLTTA